MNTIFGFFKEKLLPILMAINSVALITLLTVGAIIVNKLDKLEAKVNAVSYSQMLTNNDAISTSPDGIVLDLKSNSVMAAKASWDIEYPKTESTTKTVTTTTSCTNNTRVTETVSTKSSSSILYATKHKSEGITTTATSNTTAYEPKAVTTVKSKNTASKAVTTTVVEECKVVTATIREPIKVEKVQTEYPGTKKELLSALEHEFYYGETLVIKNVPVFNEYSSENCNIKSTIPDWNYVLAVKCSSGDFKEVFGEDGFIGTLVYGNKNFTDIELESPHIYQTIRIGAEYYTSEAIISKLLEGVEAPAHYESVNVWTAPFVNNF